jgi:threonine/homoserine/homoserine lactone efflux protein
MYNLLPTWPLLSAFLLASLALAVTPGPGVFYIVGRSVLQGRRFGMASVAGVALGNLGNALGAALGLAALFAVSSLAFAVVKYAGAAFLVYLGIRALRATPGEAPAQPLAPASLWPIFRDGFAVALLNPKTALFFAAFLPQFMHPDASAVLQGAVLGTTFVLIAAATDSIYALAASALAPWLARTRGLASASRWVTGGAFIGLGVFAAVSGSRGGK